MKNRPELNAKIWKIVTVAILSIMLFSTIAFAKVEVKIDQQDDNVKFIVKNVGNKPAYVLNALTILDEGGNIFYTSQDPSSAELLNINPGISYVFELDSENMPEGSYTGKIFQGDSKRSLAATSIDLRIKERPGKPVLYADKKFYKYGKDVDITFRNMGLGTIYVNVNNWKITSLETGKIVNSLSQDCTFGYGGCADSFEPLRFMQKVKQTWDQKDSSGNQVNPGSYIVTAEYSVNNPASGTPEIKTISSNKFFIKPQKR